MRNWEFEEWFAAIFFTVLITAAITGITLAIISNQKYNARNRDCVLAGYAGYTMSVTVPSCWKPVGDGNVLMVPYSVVVGE